jgi:putative ABC transport system substrate-binding protein
MRRREFIALMGGAAAPSLLRPLAALAQQRMPVIGYLSSASSGEVAQMLAAFRQGLSQSGYVEGRNVAIEYRWGENQYDRLPALAADLVRRHVAVIAATGGIVAALAAKAATAAIPIVFQSGVDPVALGLVASLGRPGSNITGAVGLNVELGPKQLELLHEMVPAASIVALLVNPTNPNAETVSRDLQAAARTLGLELHVLHASTEPDLETVFATLLQLRAGALIIGADSFLGRRSELLAALALRHMVPVIYQNRDFAAAGGLMSYGGNVTEPHRQVGIYTGRILKGEKPGDLPVMQSSKVELVINMKTAKALGLTVPLPLLAFADEVIE